MMAAIHPRFILVRLGRVRFQGLSQGGADILRICTDHEIFLFCFGRLIILDPEHRVALD